MSLTTEVRGSGPALVLLHGFTQTGRLFGPFADEMEKDFTLIALDLPGHGDAAAVRTDLVGTAALVRAAVNERLGDEPFALFGYSLGARVALHVATAPEPSALAALVVIGATGGIEDPSARAARRAADEVMADTLERSGDVEGFLDRWLSGPMFSRLGGAADVAQRRRNTAAGLASSLRLCGTGTQNPLWGALEAVSVPTLALAGTDDNRFAAHALRLARDMPRCVATLVPGGGHAVHLAQPTTTAAVIAHWLSFFMSPPQSRA